MTRAVILAFFLFAQCDLRAQQQEKSEPLPDLRMPGTRNVVIGPDDALAISVPESEEMSRTWRVGPAGDLNLPLVGKIQPAGKKVDDFEQELTSKLKEFIHDPHVYVSVVDLKSHPVTVMGAVGTPGTVQMSGPKTLLEILNGVGGPKEAGSTLTVTRKRESGPIPLPRARQDKDGAYYVVDLEMKDVLAANTEAANLIIQPYDVISVPAQSKQQKLVHIIGEVTKPGAIELVQQQTVSVIQVLAAAGGVTRTAAPRKTLVVHVNPEGVRTEIASLDLTKIMEGRVKDLELVAGDILIVPSSQLKTYWDATLKSTLQYSPIILTRF